MDIFDIYLNASSLTKTIIGSYWVLIGMITALYLRYFSIRGFIFSIIWIIVSFFIITLLTDIPIYYFTILYLVPSLILALPLIFLFRFLGDYFEAPEKPLLVKVFLKGKRKPLLVNTQLGVAINGAAGSGKTASGAVPILKHYGRNNVGGAVYDYKDFELTEMVMEFYKDSEIPVYVFAPFDPTRSIQYNVLDPKFISSDEQLKMICLCITANLMPEGGNDGKFFMEAAEGAIVGITYILRDKYPKYCSFTYLAAIFLSKDVEELVDLIESSRNATIQARAFLDGAFSPKQMAAVKGTISNAFAKIANPKTFYTLSRTSVDFSLNESGNKAVLCAVNKPSLDLIYEPVLSVVMQSLIQSMSERDRDPSYLLLDEATTLKINRIVKVPATMRSFKVATIYMVQDIVQSTIQIGRDKMKALFANLSVKYFGKTNDPDTAKFYESYFDEKDFSRLSKSFKSSGWSETDRRTTKSEQKEKEVKSYETMKRKAGQFYIFDQNGNLTDGSIKLPSFKTKSIQPTNPISDYELERYYDSVFSNVKSIK